MLKGLFGSTKTRGGILMAGRERERIYFN